MASLAGGAPGKIVLAVNCGSSSLKFGLFRVAGNQAQELCDGEAEKLGTPHSSFWMRAGQSNEKTERQMPLSDLPAAFDEALRAMAHAQLPSPQAVGHRVVHGGTEVREHCLITAELLARLRAGAVFAPLHVPPALSVMSKAAESMPGVPQVACLDTAFHRTMPDVASTLPLPAGVRSRGVQKFGFHGLSMESIVRQLDPLPPRLVVAHLGGGCSLTAILRGRSIDNTMGLTPTGGILMGTRPGDLDPGVLLFLLRNGYASASALEELLDRQCGLLGLSETTSDMRELGLAQNTDPRAGLALRLFAYEVTKAIASMAAALAGIDALVFTGGIGEHAHDWRQSVCHGLTFLGPFSLHVLPSQEDLAIALITARLCA